MKSTESAPAESAMSHRTAISTDVASPSRSAIKAATTRLVTPPHPRRREERWGRSAPPPLQRSLPHASYDWSIS